MRLDLFLKQTTLIKRRTIAKELADKGRIFINEKVAKPSSEVRSGDVLKLVLGNRIVTCTAGFEVKGKREFPIVIDSKVEKHE
mgnify:CR=1 FL=1